MAPDVEVELDPKSVASGHDPQLERAVSHRAGATQEESAAGAESSGISGLSALLRGEWLANGRGRPVIRGAADHRPVSSFSTRSS